MQWYTRVQNFPKPEALFLISVGILSDRNAGIGPKPVEVTNTTIDASSIFPYMGYIKYVYLLLVLSYSCKRPPIIQNNN
jgi:hypothetical protein